MVIGVYLDSVKGKTPRSTNIGTGNNTYTMNNPTLIDLIHLNRVLVLISEEALLKEMLLLLVTLIDKTSSKS